MPRLFTALEVPSQVAVRLSMLRAGVAGAKWIDPANYHITLRFVGDVNDIEATDFADALVDIEAESFEVEISGLGSFGGHKPRSIWAGVKLCEPLLRLQKLNEKAARRAGLDPEPQNYAPHITLARLRYASAMEVADYLTQFGGLVGVVFPVKRFVLFSARAFQGGGPYVPEETYSLYSPKGATDEEE
ncbi:MAG: RNA 2',3'-cyclic phosphodiesterase [Hyphomicrobiales bacterium]|nr:RNA 2',3'-cyclic phosphodiesterase [Hyphomicrobiales bacterium]